MYCVSDHVLVEAKKVYLRCVALHTSDESDLEVYRPLFCGSKGRYLVMKQCVHKTNNVTRCAHRYVSDDVLVEAKEAYLRCIAFRASDETDLEVRAHVGVAKLDMVLGEL